VNRVVIIKLLSIIKIYISKIKKMFKCMEV